MSRILLSAKIWNHEGPLIRNRWLEWEWRAYMVEEKREERRAG
jgi:hypothetical protein